MAEIADAVGRTEDNVDHGRWLVGTETGPGLDDFGVVTNEAAIADETTAESNERLWESLDSCPSEL